MAGMNPEFGNYIHDALDMIEHTSTIAVYSHNFATIQGLLLQVQPWLPEAYIATRFVYGLRPEYQMFVLRFRPITVLAAHRLATIYEESIKEPELRKQTILGFECPDLDPSSSLILELGNFLHDNLDQLTHTTSVEVLYHQFATLKSFIAATKPWLPESYFADRFVYCLQDEYQRFVFSFHPITVQAAYKLAWIYEESLYLHYFPEEIISTEDLSHEYTNIVGDPSPVLSGDKVNDFGSAAEETMENSVDGSAIRFQSQDTPTSRGVVVAVSGNTISAMRGPLNISAQQILPMGSLVIYRQSSVVTDVHKDEDPVQKSPGPKSTYNKEMGSCVTKEPKVHPPDVAAILWDLCFSGYTVLERVDSVCISPSSVILVDDQSMVTCPSIIHHCWEPIENCFSAAKLIKSTFHMDGSKRMTIMQQLLQCVYKNCDAITLGPSIGIILQVFKMQSCDHLNICGVLKLIYDVSCSPWKMSCSNLLPPHSKTRNVVMALHWGPSIVLIDCRVKHHLIFLERGWLWPKLCHSPRIDTNAAPARSFQIFNNKEMVLWDLIFFTYHWEPGPLASPWQNDNDSWSFGSKLGITTQCLWLYGTFLCQMKFQFSPSWVQLVVREHDDRLLHVVCCVESFITVVDDYSVEDTSMDSLCGYNVLFSAIGQLAISQCSATQQLGMFLVYQINNIKWQLQGVLPATSKGTDQVIIMWINGVEAYMFPATIGQFLWVPLLIFHSWKGVLRMIANHIQEEIVEVIAMDTYVYALEVQPSIICSFPKVGHFLFYGQADSLSLLEYVLLVYSVPPRVMSHSKNFSAGMFGCDKSGVLLDHITSSTICQSATNPVCTELNLVTNYGVIVRPTILSSDGNWKAKIQELLEVVSDFLGFHTAGRCYHMEVLLPTTGTYTHALVTYCPYCVSVYLPRSVTLWQISWGALVDALPYKYWQHYSKPFVDQIRQREFLSWINEIHRHYSAFSRCLFVFPATRNATSLVYGHGYALILVLECGIKYFSATKEGYNTLLVKQPLAMLLYISDKCISNAQMVSAFSSAQSTWGCHRYASLTGSSLVADLIENSAVGTSATFLFQPKDCHRTHLGIKFLEIITTPLWISSHRLLQILLTAAGQSVHMPKNNTVYGLLGKILQGKSYCGGRVSGFLIKSTVTLLLEPTVQTAIQLPWMNQLCFYQYVQFMRGVYFPITCSASQPNQGYILCYDPGIDKLCVGNLGVLVWGVLKIFTTQELCMHAPKGASIIAGKTHYQGLQDLTLIDSSSTKTTPWQGSRCYDLGIGWPSIFDGRVEQWGTMKSFSVLYEALVNALSMCGCVGLSHGTGTMVAVLWRIAWTSIHHVIYIYVPHLDP